VEILGTAVNLRALVILAAGVVCLRVPASAQEVTLGGSDLPQWSVVRDLMLAEPAAPLTTVSDVAVAGDGSLYVVQSDEHLVRKFDRDGAVLLTVGRRGRGPGEFQYPWSIGMLGDTVVVGDDALVRITEFDPQGRTLETFTTLQLTAVPHRPVTRLANGLILVETIPGSDDDVATGKVTERELLLLGSGNTAATRLVGLNLGLHSEARIEVRRGGEPTLTYFEHPFPDADLYDVDPMGRGVVVVSQAGAGESNPVFEVTRFTPDGRKYWQRAFRYTPVRPSAMVRDTIAALVDKLARSPLFPGVPRGQLERAIRDDIKVPPFLAPVSSVIAGSDGTTWIRREPANLDATWIVLDAEGAPIAEATMPFDLTVYQANLGYVWGVEGDKFDEPHLVRYRIRLSTGR